MDQWLARDHEMEFFRRELDSFVPDRIFDAHVHFYDLDLDLSRNYLSGRIPPGLAGLTNLGSLVLEMNFLSGSIPLELGSMGSLRSVDLGGNNPSFCVPSELPEISRRSVRLCSPEEVDSP